MYNYFKLILSNIKGAFISFCEISFTSIILHKCNMSITYKTVHNYINMYVIMYNYIKLYQIIYGQNLYNFISHLYIII